MPDLIYSYNQAIHHNSFRGQYCLVHTAWQHTRGSIFKYPYQDINRYDNPENYRNLLTRGHIWSYGSIKTLDEYDQVRIGRNGCHTDYRLESLCFSNLLQQRNIPKWLAVSVNPRNLLFWKELMLSPFSNLFLRNLTAKLDWLIFTTGQKTKACGKNLLCPQSMAFDGCLKSMFPDVCTIQSIIILIHPLSPALSMRQV